MPPYYIVWTKILLKFGTQKHLKIEGKIQDEPRLIVAGRRWSLLIRLSFLSRFSLKEKATDSP